MTNPRIAKLQDQIQQIVAEMLQRRIKDPRLGFVTVTDVRLTGDAREATVFYTVLGQEQDLKGTAIGLESAKGLLRSTVGKKLGLKFAPTLTFVLDATIIAAQDIEQAVARALSADEQLAQARQGAAYAGDADPYRKPADEFDDDDDEFDDDDDEFDDQEEDSDEDFFGEGRPV